MGKLPVLVSAQIVSDDIPPPEVNLNEEGNPDASRQEAQILAGDGKTDLNSSSNDPFQSSVQETQAHIDQEATGVGLIEWVKLLTDESQSGLDASDFGQEVCNAVGSVKDSMSTLDNVTRLYDILDQQDSQGSNDVENAVKDGVQLFTHAFGSCIDTLSVAERIVEDIEALFCQ
jgi:hypothetical protein